MGTNGVDLLRSLASGIRPDGAPLSAPAASGDRARGPDFGAMLDQARRGELRTGVPVAIEPGLELSLSDDQRSALAVAADKAEAAGASHALVLLDDLTLVLDVTARQVVDTADLATQNVLGGIDAVVRADSSDPERTGGGARGPSSGLVGNASLLEALSRIDNQRAGAA